MLKANLITVEHSGSRAVLNSLRSGIDTVTGAVDQVGVGDYIFFAHISSQPVSELDKLAAPIVYTVRDPLASLVSTIARGEGHRQARVNDWVDLVELTERRESYPVCIGFGEPEKQLQTIFTDCDLYDKPLPLRDFGAYDGNSPLQDAYKAKDRQYLLEKIPDEIAMLQEKSSVVYPWLEKHGLTDLMWCN